MFRVRSFAIHNEKDGYYAIRSHILSLSLFLFNTHTHTHRAEHNAVEFQFEKLLNHAHDMKIYGGRLCVRVYCMHIV